MEIFSIKKTIRDGEVPILSKFFNLPERDTNDLKWLIALKIRESFYIGTMKRKRQTQFLPLEISDPQEFGELDNDQKFYINSGAYDLVLIENASELVRRLMHEQMGNLELFLDLIIKEAPNCEMLPVMTIPEYYTFKTLQKNPEYRFNKIRPPNKEEYTKQIKQLQLAFRGIKPATNIVVALLGLSLEEAGGHYAAFIWKRPENTVTVFDSMAAGEYGSYYYDVFEQWAEDIFSPIKVVKRPCISPLLSDEYRHVSLQETGGFPETRSSFLDAAEIKKTLTHKEINLAQNQSTESQNHFCYFWSIWYIHLTLANIDFSSVLTAIRGYSIDPLCIIKKYIWSMLKATELEADIEYHELYENYFNKIWTTETFPSTKFKPFEIKMPVCKTPLSCLKASFSPLSLTLVPETPVPDEVIKVSKLSPSRIKYFTKEYGIQVSESPEY